MERAELLLGVLWQRFEPQQTDGVQDATCPFRFFKKEPVRYPQTCKHV